MTAAPAAQPEKGPSTGAFAPLGHRLFAVIWAATVLGNTGSFMRDVASAWLVTDLSPSPTAVALIQAAATVPVFLFAVPAGVLSDILDRRRFLVFTQLWMTAVSLALAIVAGLGLASVPSLLMLTFLGASAAALSMPAWQAITPELVPRAELKPAVALNSLGFNISRAIGPAAGGVILAAAGAAVTYAVDVASYLLVIAALLWWKRDPAADDGLREQFGGALRAGLRYARASKDLHRLLWRAVLFFAFASGVWALLPIVARSEFGGGPGFYGLMLGSIGAGAITGALVMPGVRNSLGQDRLVLAASVVFGVCTAVLPWIRMQALGVSITFVLGIAWIAILTTFNSTAQGVLPNWVRGRGLAIYLTAFNGAMAIGSVGWGLLAQWIGTAPTLLVSGAGLVAGALFVHRATLPRGEEDLTPSMHWAAPSVVEPVGHERGPVMVTVTYRVAATDRPAFLTAIERLSEERRRDGAYAWGVAEDSADAERIVEWFFVESWAEHMRQHRRVSKADAEIQSDLRRLHRGPGEPEVSHFLALDRPPDR